MLYCSKCHYVVLDEEVLRDIVNYLDSLASMHISSDFDLNDFLDAFNDIISESDGGDEDVETS